MIRLAVYGVAAALVVAAYHFTPVIGPGARIERLSADRDKWKAASTEWKRAAVAWEGSFRKSEDYRAIEQRDARVAQDEAQQACSARVARARASAAAIATLVSKEPRRDPNGCPVRALADADVLRDALSPRPIR